MEELTEGNDIGWKMLLENKVFATAQDGKTFSVREAIRDNRLGQVVSKRQDLRYQKWLLWLSIILALKSFTHASQPLDWDVKNPTKSLYRARCSQSSQASEKSTESDPADQSSSNLDESELTRFGELETLMAQSVDLASFLQNRNGNPDLNFFLLRNRHLCITHAGHLGIIPSSAQENDAILVFPGAVTRFVVRNEENNSYRLVGDCFVRGLMHAEGLRENDIKDIVIS